ncbi:MAG: hypothetical protein ACE5KI_04060 [Dehalococcoidia bacterium]
MDNFGFLFGAFAIGWAVFMGLGFWLYRKVLRMRQEVDDLKRQRGQGAGD